MNKKIATTLFVILTLAVGIGAFWFGHWWRHFMERFVEPEWWHTPLEATGYVLGCAVPAVLICLSPAGIVAIWESKS